MNNQPTTPQQNIDYSQFGNYSDSAKQAIQGGASLQDVQNAYSQIQAQQPKGNWFERALPTIGGIGGGILGSLVSPIVGSAVGAGAGSALGQELENVLTGSKGSTLAAGVESGAGGLLGGAGGSIISKLAGKFISPLAEKGAAATFAGQVPGVGKDLSTFMTKDMGLADANVASNFGKIVTGGTGELGDNALLTRFLEDKLQTAGPQKVSASDLFMGKIQPKTMQIGEQVAAPTNKLQQLINSNYLASTPQAQGIRTNVNGIFNAFKADAEGNIAPLDALNAQRQVNSLASQAFDDASRTGDAATRNIAKVYQGLSDELKNRLNLGNIQVTPEEAKALANDLYTNGSSISQSAAIAMRDRILGQANSQDGLTLSGLRNEESNWVKVQQALGQAQQKAEKQFGTSAMNIAKGTIGAATSPKAAAAQLALSSSAADKVASGLLGNISKKLTGRGVQQILPRATAALGAAGGSIPALAGSVTPAQGQNNLTGATTMQGQQAGMGGAQPQSTLEDVLNTYMGIGMTDPYLLSATSPVVQALAPQVQKQQQAAALLGGLGQAYGQAGGPQGLGGGLLSQITGLVPGTAANVYGRQQQATSAALANLLGISPQAALGLTPQLTATPQAAQAPLGVLSGLLNSLQ